MEAPFQPRFVSRLTRDTLALVLAGGRGSRLGHLVDWRTKPAVPFGGKFRIIDFPLSNSINSGIRRIGVLTQYKSHSLIRHIQKGWGFLRGEFGEFVELLPAQQRLDKSSWYAGTADALYQNLDIIRSHQPEFVLVLAGDHIYKMDYGPMIAAHVESNADLTIACIPVNLDVASSFGVMAINEDKRILRFQEKPKSPEPIPDDPTKALASMGIYVFNAQFLCRELELDAQSSNSSHDFGNDVIPKAIANASVFAYPFGNNSGTPDGLQTYWRDVGTLDAFWAANTELLATKPDLDLYDQRWPIWTYQEQLPPAKFIYDDEKRSGIAINSMVSGGCLIDGSTIVRSVLFSNVKVYSGSMIEDAVILPNVNIGSNCQIRRAIIDKSCNLPANTKIGFDPEEDAKRFEVSSHGISLVTPDMLGQEF